jgi:hypothetical protein
MCLSKSAFKEIRFRNCIEVPSAALLNIIFSYYHGAKIIWVSSRPQASPRLDCNPRLVLFIKVESPAVIYTDKISRTKIM